MLFFHKQPIEYTSSTTYPDNPSPMYHTLIWRRVKGAILINTSKLYHVLKLNCFILSYNLDKQA